MIGCTAQGSEFGNWKWRRCNFCQLETWWLGDHRWVGAEPSRLNTQWKGWVPGVADTLIVGGVVCVTPQWILSIPQETHALTRILYTLFLFARMTQFSRIQARKRFTQLKSITKNWRGYSIALTWTKICTRVLSGQFFFELGIISIKLFITEVWTPLWLRINEWTRK